MRRFLGMTWAAAALAALVFAVPATAADEEGFEPIFDGKSLENWDGNPKFWSVEDGAIVGQTTKENPTKGNTFLIWRGGEVGDFELKLEYKIRNHNSGVQYRSFEVPNQKWVVGGYQADIEGGDTWTGTLYGERFRGVLCKRGDKTVIQDNHKPKVIGHVGDPKELLSHINKDGWNEYHIIAKGYHFIQKINGVVMSECFDEDEKVRRASGILALQLHAGPPMKVRFRNIRLKRLPKEENAATGARGQKKKVVFVAGRPSHGYGSHEHNAGCILLAKELKRAMPNFDVEVRLNGWPKDQSVFDGADAIVMYCDGGGGHMVIPHLNEVDKLAEQGVGIACLHYAVEVPKGKVGNTFLDWIGGYFETDWSVNPHWKASFDELPKHPITRGVEPFAINDEWYYHMRFPKGMKGVTPILTDLPPKSTLSRPDGPHSGNPAVRKAIAQGEPQHVAWAYERPNGGRGFGFTGGHFHWNWGDDNFRRTVLNAIVWISGAEVPEGGVAVEPVTREELEKNQDEPKPGAKKKKKQAVSAGTRAASEQTAGKSKPVFESKVVTTKTPGYAVEIEADIAGAKRLYLVVTDGGNGFSCDWADWAEPRLIGPGGKVKKLTELKWKSADADWGQVRVNKNAAGGEMRIQGKRVEYGIGAHANSVIAFDLPEGYTRFKARGGLDDGGALQQNGAATSVQFLVYTSKPPANVAQQQAAVGHTPDVALGGLEVGEGLAATLFAAEPMMLSPSNIDVDHRGRVWVCEIQNYRHRQGTRPEGDRILILEDLDGDGAADKRTVFYQGKDINSALGICVLGNKVIVSCAPNVFIFTDENNDGRADKKELLFTKVGTPQHDHSTHAFVFGPDGKLYWNVGNQGQAVHDKNEKIIVDMAGNEVRDNGKPYRQGMAFRCNLDGSEFEVLGHNFRNNYELTVDSFGTIWQSDNDDDGNRGVRINYVMEFGNYGYTDELTGAGWRSPRTGMHEEIPLRHWHQNDPGVVPNLLQTGGGSPTGITIYEGRLLPKVFRGEIIHCDAGPNIVRAYPTTKDGAGYEAESVPILTGVIDKWFRPSDVSVAPDGSLIVADWYDPGVGGHRMGDVERGRLYRIAPPGVKYDVPKIDVSTIEGAIEALKNPNYSARYLAWIALHERGAEAEPALLDLYKNSDNPRYRARALWLLGKIDGRGRHYIELAISDKNPDIRIVGLRLARQLDGDVLSVVAKLVRDSSPQVRRECAIALRHHKSPQAAELWAELAAQHDGQDRWYLEALGIGAAGRWDAFLAAYMKKVDGGWNTPGGRDIIWRSRAAATPKYLAEIIRDPATSAGDLPRYFRAFDFQKGEAKDATLIELALTEASGGAERREIIAAESIKRLGNLDLAKQPRYAEAVERVLKRLAGTSEYVGLVDKFNVKSHYPQLLALAQQKPDQQVGVEAIRVLLAKNARPLIEAGLDSQDPQVALNTALALQNSADGRALGYLLPVMEDASRSISLRRQAARGLAKTRNGAQKLLQLAKADQLDQSLRAAVAMPLNTAPWNDVAGAAAKLFPLPPAKDNQKLPPLAALIKMRGDAARGKEIFAKTGTCANCHVVNGKGKEVGPNLSEIGAKLSREAFFESILYPSAGISHNYETYAVALSSGNVLTGIITSRTDDEISIKSADALVRTFKTSEIDAIKKQNVSIMPADLQKTLSAQDLADVVEYLTTLKKAE